MWMHVYESTVTPPKLLILVGDLCHSGGPPSSGTEEVAWQSLQKKKKKKKDEESHPTTYCQAQVGHTLPDLLHVCIGGR